MKKIVLLLLIISSCSVLFAQPTPPPGGTSEAGHGLNGNQSGNGAPIDGGITTLLILGALYGIKKITKTYKMNSDLNLK